VPLRVVVAPDSFKGSISARKAAEAISTGWRSVRPHDEIVIVPQADGGEGTLDAIESAVAGAIRQNAGTVTGPDGRPVDGVWLELPGRIAVVELAQCSGLTLMGQLDPLRATTRGLGEVIRAALSSGATSLIIALGGSASTDGGSGALAALGLAMLDHRGDTVSDGGAALRLIESIDRSGLLLAPTRGVILLTDVTAPLLGPTGAAAVFGPQKGADSDQVATLDAALTHFAHLMGGDASAAGTGAAGGAGFGFASVWNARLTSGADYLASLTGLPAEVARADVLITGEGRFDDQSRTGKVVGQLLTLASACDVTVGVIAGQVTTSTDLWTASLTEIAGSVDAALATPTRWLAEAGARAARELAPRF
jgi:glycerate kinase